MKVNELKRGDVCSFNLYPSGIRKDTYKDLIYMSSLDVEDARSLGVACDYLHAQMISVLPNNKLRANDYNWLRFKSAHSGEILTIGSAWIKESSLTTLTNKTAIVKLHNQPSDILTRLRVMLLANGIDVGQMEIYFED